MRTLVLSMIFFAAAGSANLRAADGPVADATMAEARRHADAGRKAFDAGDFVSAIREWKAAAALRPAPRLDYDIALANERLGRTRVAIAYYQRYLVGAPTAPDRAEIEARVSQLQQRAGGQP